MPWRREAMWFIMVYLDIYTSVGRPHFQGVSVFGTFIEAAKLILKCLRDTHVQDGLIEWPQYKEIF